MADSKDIFTTKVVPIMDRVRDNLNSKIADEYHRHSTSAGAMMAGAAGPDGGMSSMAAYDQRIFYIGEWTSKNVEDYIEMVKAELKKSGITVDAVMEKKMVDHLVKQQMPKSATDYILRKAAESTLFYMPQRARTSSMQDYINKEGENLYNPALWEDITANLLGWAANASTTVGYGGFWGQTAIDAGAEGSSHLAPGQQEKYVASQAELAKQEFTAATKKKITIPKWMLTQMGFERMADAKDEQLVKAYNWAKSNGDIYMKHVTKALESGSRIITLNGKEISLSEATTRTIQYKAFARAIEKEQAKRKDAEQKEEAKTSDIAEAVETPAANTSATTSAAQQETSTSNTQENGNAQEQQNAQGTQGAQTTQTASDTGNYNGWNNLLDSLGLAGSGDTFRHLGLTLATLPDMLLEVFTGRTKSIGLNKGTMMPLAALIGGSFIKNPLLKIPLMLFGGVNLVNRIGQEALSDYRQEHGIVPQPQQQQVRYKQYADEELNPRITKPHVEGSVLIVDIDHVPRIVTMPPSLADAYHSGAIPLNTLANHILAKTDQMQQTTVEQQSQDVSSRYEQRQQREQVRGIR